MPDTGTQIPATLAHPEIQGPPLDRGVRYIHNFAVELISDGRRLWAVASEQGRRVLHAIEHGLDPADYPAEQPEAMQEGRAIGAAASLDASDIERAEDQAPPAGAEAPTTQTIPGNTFG